MRFDPDNLPETYEELKEAYLALGSEFLKLQAQLAELLQGQQGLQNQLQALAEMLQPKSERRPAAPRRDKARAKRGHGPRPQPELEKREVLLELDEADCICPDCGEPLEQMTGCTQDSERIDYQPQEYVLLVCKRQKYNCRQCGHIETALALPSMPGERRYTTRFSVQVAIDKYADHLPLNRQVQRMRRQGLECSEQVLWDRLDKMATLLEPNYLALKEHLQGKSVLGCDASEWRLLDKGRKKRPIVVLCAEDAAFYSIVERCDNEAIAQLVGEFEGFLVSDGESCFSAAENREDTRFRGARCLAHVRRYFVKAHKDFKGPSQQAIELISGIYDIDRDFKEGRISAEQRQARMAAGWAWLDAWRGMQRTFPQGKLGKALNYLDNQWDSLQQTIEHPQLWLDNNSSERALRRPVLGRKNHYGSKSERGLQVAAIFFSILESCARCNVDPADYLQKALDEYAQPRPNIILPHHLRDN